jgi:predicted protein tyrosine phosphatase
MQEVYPGLWLGSLSAVRAVAGNNNDSAAATLPNVQTWTVVTVLNSSRLISLTRTLLRGRIAEGTCRHVVWELEDKSGAVFLSRRLKSILAEIDSALSLQRPADDDASRKHLDDEENGRRSCLLQKQPTKSACLVHCAQGVSRSVSVVAAWLISRKHASLQDALDVIRNARPEAMPNMGFIASLRALEQCNGDLDLAMERMFNGTSNTDDVEAQDS